MLSQRTSDPANFRWTPGTPGTVSYGMANNINQYPTVGGVGFSYSTDGNLTNDGVFKYEFNSERMMTRVRDAGTNAIIADYLYDPALRQRQKNVGGTKTNFYYAGWQRLADYDGTTNTLQQRYVYGPGLDEVLIQISSGGTKTYFHGNHQGSVIATTDASGAVLNRFKYSPYGESPSMSGTSHGYTGQRYDSETGLYYCKMRHYSSKLGRFLQTDPIRYAGGLNLYAYVGNRPTRAIDPLGLAAEGGSPRPYPDLGRDFTLTFYGDGSDRSTDWSEWQFGVYFHDTARIGLHASIIGTRTRTVLLGSGGSKEKGDDYIDYALKVEYLNFSSGPGGPLDRFNVQRTNEDRHAQIDTMKQFAAMNTPEAKNNFILGSGDLLKDLLIEAANAFSPGGTGVLYNPTPVYLPGTNSNNYVRYLLDSVGYRGDLSTLSGSAPGLNESIRNNGQRNDSIDHYGQWEDTAYRLREYVNDARG